MVPQAGRGQEMCFPAGKCTHTYWGNNKKKTFGRDTLKWTGIWANSCKNIVSKKPGRKKNRNGAESMQIDVGKIFLQVGSAGAIF
jgi:hypothetical protein